MHAFRLESLEARALLSTVTLLNGMPAPTGGQEAIIEIEPISSWGTDGHEAVEQPLAEQDQDFPPMLEIAPGPDEDMYAFRPGVDDAVYEDADVPFGFEETSTAGPTSSTEPSGPAITPASVSWLDRGNRSDRGTGAMSEGRIKSSFISEGRPSYRDLQL